MERSEPYLIIKVTSTGVQEVLVCSIDDQLELHSLGIYRRISPLIREMNNQLASNEVQNAG